MDNRYLLDTNAIIDRMNGDENLERVLMGADAIFTSAIALGELYYGAEKSVKREDNMARIDKIAAQIPILVCDRETAIWYGRIESHLRASGQPIPQNDVWITAAAKQHSLAVLTRDVHFEKVRTFITIRNWTK